MNNEGKIKGLASLLLGVATAILSITTDNILLICICALFSIFLYNSIKKNTEEECFSLKVARTGSLFVLAGFIIVAIKLFLLWDIINPM